MSYTETASKWKALLVIVTTIAILSGNADVAATVATPAAGHHPRDADYPHTYISDDVVVYAKTSAQVDLALWGMTVYADAGLALPHIEIWMGSDTSQCIHPSGNQTRGFATWRDGRVVLFHCGDAFTMLHELAHVYDRHALSDADRSEFLGLRDLQQWQDTSAWDQSGEEHFANVVAWGLDERSRREVHTPPTDAASMSTAFDLVIGFGA